MRGILTQAPPLAPLLPRRKSCGSDRAAAARKKQAAFLPFSTVDREISRFLKKSLNAEPKKAKKFGKNSEIRQKADCYTLLQTVT